MPIWFKIVLWLALGATVTVVAVILWVVSALSGGLGRAVGFHGPTENDPKVLAARATAVTRLTTRADALAKVTASAFPGGGAVLARATASACQTGQHNFEVHNSFDLSCTVTVSIAVVMHPGDFRSQALAAGTVLAAATGTPDADTHSVNAMIGNYWDRRAEFTSFPGYSPADLPEAIVGPPGPEAVSVTFTDPTGGLNARNGKQDYRYAPGSWTLPGANQPTTQPIYLLLPNGQNAIILSLTNTYWEK